MRAIDFNLLMPQYSKLRAASLTHRIRISGFPLIYANMLDMQFIY